MTKRARDNDGQLDGGGYNADEDDNDCEHQPKVPCGTGSPPGRPNGPVHTTRQATSAWRSVCLLEVVSVEWIYMCPWARASQKAWSGSGFCIEGRRIITNAHVVKSAIDIRVRQHSNARRYPAKVLFYGPDVDLAVLEIASTVAEEFWGNVGPDAPVVLADSLPALQETVRAIGFPRGGKTICITEGVVSRIDSIELTPPADSTCVIQIDAAINPGNSGGPVFNTHGQVTGVAFCKDVRSESDNIGYVIPAEVVIAFLERCRSDGEGYVLSPSVPYRWHKLENKSLRWAHGVPDSVSGVLMTSVAPSASSALRANDVLTKIDGRRISDDGQVVLRGDELIQHRYLLRGKRVAEPTVFTVFRDGVEVESPGIILKDLPPICARWADTDYLPEYLVLGALALVPLAQPLGWYKQQCPTELQATIAQWNRRWPGEMREGKDELVVLLNVFAHELTFGYVRLWRVVKAYNGVAVASLRHLREMWHATREEVIAARAAQSAAQANNQAADQADPEKSADRVNRIMVRLELEHDDDIVLGAAAAMDAEAQVLKTHAIARASFVRGDP